MSVCLSVCLCICLCIINKICPLASVTSFGDIAIIFSEQLGIVAKEMFWGEIRQKTWMLSGVAIFFYKKATSRLTVSILATL